jgi:hypothetical protein
MEELIVVDPSDETLLDKLGKIRAAFKRVRRMLCKPPFPCLLRHPFAPTFARSRSPIFTQLNSNLKQHQSIEASSLLGF